MIKFEDIKVGNIFQSAPHYYKIVRVYDGQIDAKIKVDLLQVNKDFISEDNRFPYSIPQINNYEWVYIAPDNELENEQFIDISNYLERANKFLGE